MYKECAKFLYYAKLIDPIVAASRSDTRYLVDVVGNGLVFVCVQKVCLVTKEWCRAY